MEPLTATDPRMVGDFRLRARLGAGGMGRVYLATSPAGRIVAVKVIQPELASDQEFLRRFRGEVDSAKMVSGMYTAPVVAAGVDDRQPWLATAFVPGPSLDDVVSRHGPLPVAALWKLAAGLAEALGSIHSAGLVHRDMKPANVLLASDGPRVIDFGISRAFTDTRLTATGSVIGTPGYMSPEQVEGHPSGPPSDVFSLGCVLAFAASGRSPFSSGATTSPAVALYRVVHGEPDLAAVAPDVRELITACLAKEPARRPDPGQIAARCAAAAGYLGLSPAAFWPGDVAGVIQAQQNTVMTELQALEVPATHLAGGPPPFAATGPAGRGGATHPSTALAGSGTPAAFAPPAQGGPMPASAPGFPGAAPPGFPGANPGFPGGSGHPSFPNGSGQPGGPGPAFPNGPSYPGTPAPGFPGGPPGYPGGPGSPVPPAQFGGVPGQIAPPAPYPGRHAPQGGPKPGRRGFIIGATVVGAGIVGASVYALADKKPASRSGSAAAGTSGSGSGRLAWTFQTHQEVDANPTVANGIVYVGSSDNQLYAVSAATGHQVWSLPANSVTAAPTVAAGVMCASATQGNFYAARAATGSLIWTLNGNQLIDFQRNWAIDGNNVAVALGTEDVRMYDAVTGAHLWTATTSAPGGYVQNIAASLGMVFALDFDGTIHALDAATGKENGHLQVIQNNNSPSTELVASGDSLYLGAESGPLYAINAQNGTLRWATPPSTGSPESNPVVADGVVYFNDFNSTLHAVDATDGKLLWTFHAGGDSDDSPVVMDGKVYIPSGEGLQQLDAKTGKAGWVFTPSSFGTFNSSPAAANGLVFIGCDDYSLYAIRA